MVINNASSELQWQVIRKNSAFIRRQRGINKHFSTEKFNLKGVNSPVYNGLINKHGVDVRVDAGKKEVVITTKNASSSRTPAKATVATRLKSSGRATKKVNKIVSNYQKDLRVVSLDK